MDSEGWLRITGRLKEQYKLINGKYVVPTPVEEAIGMSRFISQVVLAGANRPHNVALIVPDWGAVRSELGKDGDDSKNGSNEREEEEEEMVNDPSFRELIDAEIALHCSSLKKFEIPKGWAVAAPFTSSNGMLTPKMSIRRHVVLKTYEDSVADLYGDGDRMLDVLEPADGAHSGDGAAEKGGGGVLGGFGWLRARTEGEEGVRGVGHDNKSPINKQKDLQSRFTVGGKGDDLIGSVRSLPISSHHVRSVAAYLPLLPLPLLLLIHGLTVLPQDDNHHSDESLTATPRPTLIRRINGNDGGSFRQAVTLAYRYPHVVHETYDLGGTSRARHVPVSQFTPESTPDLG